ncbi:MAG: ATP-binding protein [Candidatus Desantisbacteria bacterium]
MKLFPNKILMIEDNPDDVIITKRVIGKASEECEIEVASTGKEGMERLEKSTFDCLLLDHHLPDTNALEFLKKVRENYPHLPVIILTGLHDDRLLTGALKLGAVNFLTKDKIDGLSETILQAVVSGRRAGFLDKQEYVYTKLIESMGEGLFALDIQGVIVFVNQRMAEILAYSEAELLGQSIFSLIKKNETKRWEEEYQEIRQGRRRAFEIDLVGKTKGVIPALINLTPLFDDKESFNGSLGLVADLSELKRMEARLRESERLTVMSQIAGEAVHEIRNPLSIIRTGLYLLKSYIPKNEKTERKLSQIDEAITRTTSYLEDLLSLSRPPILNAEIVDLKKAIEQSLEEIPPYFLANIILTKDIPEGLFIEADLSRLKQVFVNLIKNSCEIMKAEGKLEILAERGQTEEGDFVLIRFADAGHGIPIENLEKIFDPFFTTKSKGTGLGLATCKRIVEAHQGEIAVESRLNMGAKFTVKLPMKGKSKDN